MASSEQEGARQAWRLDFRSEQGSDGEARRRSWLGRLPVVHDGAASNSSNDDDDERQQPLFLRETTAASPAMEAPLPRIAVAGGDESSRRGGDWQRDAGWWLAGGSAT